MKGRHSPALAPRRVLLTGLIALAAAAALCAGFAASLDLGLAGRHPELGLGWSVAPLFGLEIALCLAFTWCLRLRREVVRLGRRPETPQDGLPQASRHALWAAEQAFDQGDFGRVPDLLERLPEAQRGPGVWLLLGRSLALAGDVERAVPALERGNEARKTLRLLAARRPGRGGPPLIASLPARLRRLPGAALLVLALSGLAAGSWTLLESRASAVNAAPSFDETAFLSRGAGRFTFYYHDPAFLDYAAPLAQDALDADLAFLGLGPRTFAPGELRVYLCDSEAEYRRRAPTHPPWEAACADPPRASVYLYPFGQDEASRVGFEITLAHELGHLCYYRLAGTAPDDWLNEGLADYLGFRFGLDREGIPRQAWLQEHYFKDLPEKALPFDRFFRVDPHQLPDSEVDTFYRQGFSVVYLLVEDYGREPFLGFLKAFGRTKDVDRALGQSYPTIPDVAALAAVWGLFYPREPDARQAASGS